MFNGIVKNIGVVKKIMTYRNGKRIGIKTKFNFSKKDIGSSINCSGACLTLEKIRNNLCYFYLSKETLDVSNFKYLKLNDYINLELPLKFGSIISGHFVQGHVDTIAKLKKKQIYGKSWYLYFSINAKFKKLLVYKGSIAINGVSLTVSKVLNKSFLIVVIPHTLKLTNLKFLKINDFVNIEIDILAKYINKIGK